MIRNRRPVSLVQVTLRRGATACLLLVVTASLVEAQRASSFTQLPLLVGPGDTITVTDTSGQVMKGRIAALSPSTLVLLVDGTRHDLLEADVTRIRQRRPDPLRNGVLRGFVVGAVFGALTVWGAGAPEFIPPAALANGLLGIGVGVAVDALVSSRTIIYDRAGSARRLRVSPLVSRERQGVLLSLGF